MAREDVCQACAAHERYVREKEGEHRPAGTVTSIVNTMPRGTKLDPRMAPKPLPLASDTEAEQDRPE